ncbi:unnamed protein product [Urochloa humidicola]
MYNTLTSDSHATSTNERSEGMTECCLTEEYVCESTGPHGVLEMKKSEKITAIPASSAQSTCASLRPARQPASFLFPDGRRLCGSQEAFLFLESRGTTSQGADAVEE